MRKILKLLGILIVISSAFVVVPQLLNFGILLWTGGWAIQFPFADDITHWGGFLNGSLMIPTYKEYHELGVWGIGLIIAGALGIKFGYDFFRLRPSAFKRIVVLEIFILAIIIGVIFEFGFSLSYALFYLAGLLPPFVVLTFVLLNRKNYFTGTSHVPDTL